MRSGVSTPARVPTTAPIFAALGDPCRLLIVERLCEDGPLSTIMLNHGENGVSRQGLTKHLRVLERVGLVNSFRVGRSRHWQVRSEQLTTVRAYLDEVAAEWDARLQRLQLLVKDDDRDPNTDE